jgi:glycosyltransferase involved in cell wall biosynthesis
MKPRRILHITRLAKGGLPVVLDNIVRGLDRHSFEPVVLFDTPQSSEIRDKLVASDIQTIELHKSRDVLQEKKKNPVQPKRNLGAVVEQRLGRRALQIYLFVKDAWEFLCRDIPKIGMFYRIIKDHKIDLVHTHNDFRKGKPEIMAAKIAGIPCLTHHHGYAAYTLFDKLFVNLSQANISISNHVCQHHEALGEPHSKSRVIHNGISLSDYTKSFDHSRIRDEFGCAPDDVLIGLVARIDWWKGHEYFLEALAEVEKKVGNVKGLIIGGLAELSYESSTLYEKKLHNLVVALGLEEKVIFTGHRSDVAQLVATLDVVVHASSTPEPFGLTVIEGMAAGKPVVATAAGGVLDIIEDGVNGLLVPCKDSKAMAQVILQLLSSPNMARQIGQAAQLRVAEKFTIERQVAAVQRLYGSVMAKKDH